MDRRNIIEEIERLRLDTIEGGRNSTIMCPSWDIYPGADLLAAAIHEQADPPLVDTARLCLNGREGQVFIDAAWEEPPVNKRRRSCDMVYRAFDVTAWRDGKLTEIPPDHARAEGVGKRWTPNPKAR